MQRITAVVSGRPMVAWRLAGRRPPVVCLHGAGVSSREFRPFLEVLARRHDAWSVDLPGYGASGSPLRPLGLRALTDALAEWLTAVGLDRAVLLGGSFGCQVAVDAAVRHPERITGLVLVGPSVDPAARSFMRQLVRWMPEAPPVTPTRARRPACSRQKTAGNRMSRRCPPWLLYLSVTAACEEQVARPGSAKAGPGSARRGTQPDDVNARARRTIRGSAFRWPVRPRPAACRGGG
ncbi:alpha/beta fold hydrolase [Streptomyces sp. NPDC055955]|uniref:alpha/beta fold hydrolase n=1 Tax=Streptomyces sp. NPDC055955 TaxID=3345665 RepID=UPI0035DB788D